MRISEWSSDVCSFDVGEEAISNTIWGMDASYRSDSRWLTKLVDKLPLLETRQTSTITFDAEFAHLVPGHARSLNVAGSSGGVAYIDEIGRASCRERVCR